MHLSRIFKNISYNIVSRHRGSRTACYTEIMKAREEKKITGSERKSCGGFIVESRQIRLDYHMIQRMKFGTRRKTGGKRRENT